MPRRKALKVVVDIEFHAVTCPGVFLPNREDIFINVEIFGQLKRTQYHPPVFPFLFHEKIRFEKVFSNATDPIQVAQELCAESVQIELVQLSYPGGDLLGTYSDNARDFLFPTPKVSPTYPGVDREVLFQRSATFPGIAPKLEFSSRTTIKEVTSSGRSLGEKKRREQRVSHQSGAVANGGLPQEERTVNSNPGYSKTQAGKQRPTSGKRKKTKSTSTNEARRGRSDQRSKSASRGTTMWGYEQPTIASRARSPSPYTRRRMAELAINDPFESAAKAKPFKTEVNNKPEFVVRKVPEDALSLDRTPPPPRSPRQRSSSPHRSYTSPRQNGICSPRDAYNIALSNCSDEFASDSLSDSSIDRYTARYRAGVLDKMRSSPRGRSWNRPFGHFDSMSDYLSTRTEQVFPEGRCERFIPIGRRHLSFRQSTPRSYVKYPVTCSSCPAKKEKRKLKSCLVTRSAPASGRPTPRYRYDSDFDRTEKAARITACLEKILEDVRRSDALDEEVAKYDNRQSVRKKAAAVRFQDPSELHTSLRCGRGTPTGSRLSSRSSPSPRHHEPSFSLGDLDTIPTSSYGRRHTADSILHRTPLENRLSAQPSPYEKIRDRVRALLSSPRATRIADNAVYEGQERYRHRLSQSPSPRSPRVSVRLNDKDYWNENAAIYCGKSHRDVFENNLDKIYGDIYSKLKNDNA